jgi:predicted permease
VISPGAVISSVLPVYLLMLAGGLLRRGGVLKKDGDEAVMRLVFQVMLPCYILDKLLGSEVLRSGAVVAWGLGLGFLLVACGMAVGWLAGTVIGLDRGTGGRTFALTTGCQNFGFTAVPVVEILWGGGGALALLFVHNIGVEVAIWSIGVMVMSGERGVPWRKLINGPITAVIIGMSLVALRLDTYIEGPPRAALSMLGIGAFPVAIALTGASMFDLIGSERPLWKVIVASSLVRLAIVPAVILAAAKYLPIAAELKQVLVVQAAMPAAMTPILLAKLYGGRPGIAVQVVLATTLLSLVTLPWIIAWGCRWIGLEPMLP